MASSMKNDGWGGFNDFPEFDIIPESILLSLCQSLIGETLSVFLMLENRKIGESLAGLVGPGPGVLPFLENFPFFFIF